MAGSINVFGLYKLVAADNSSRMILTRVTRPGYSDARQQQEDEAYHIESLKTEVLLAESSRKFFEAHEISVEQISTFEYVPKGQPLFEKNGLIDIELWAGFPAETPESIIVSMAGTKEEFLKFIEDDFDLNQFLPMQSVEKYTVTFVTENDFDLSAIPNYNSTDLQSKW